MKYINELKKEGSIPEEELYKFDLNELRRISSDIKEKEREILAKALKEKATPVAPKADDPEEVCKEDLNTCDKHMKQELDQ